MTRSMTVCALAVATMLIVAACGSTEETATTAGDVGASSAMGPGLSVSEALDSTGAGPFLVNGFIITDAGGTVYLAELLAESLPPQPGGAQLIVDGLDLDTFPGLTTAQGITWSDQPEQLLGEVSDGVLTVSELSSG